MYQEQILLTCAGRPLGQLLGSPSIRPCDHETAGARTLQSENLVDERNIAERGSGKNIYTLF